MSANDASNNSVNDAIIRLYLYGNKNGLGDYLDEGVIREFPLSGNPVYPINWLDYKDGPGRFAMPELFQLVRG